MAVGLLAMTGSASAATSFRIGTGNQPSVAVDAAGTGHIAWDENRTFPTPDTLHYCRVPRGQTACAGGVRSFTLPLETTQPAQVLIPAAGRVQLLGIRCCGPQEGTYLLSSADGGASFSAPALVGTQSVVNDAVPGPGASVSVAGGNPGVQFQNTPLTPPAEAQEVQFNSTYLYDVTVGLDPVRPIVVGWQIGSSSNNAAYYRYSGAGNINLASSWTGPSIIAALQDTRLSGGPSGLFLMGQSGTGIPQNNPYALRRWTGSAFAPVGNITATDRSIYENDLHQDAAGRLHAVWRMNDVPTHRLRYAVSSDGGASWTSPSDIVRAGNIFNTRVGAAPDGTGFVVWDGTGGGANNPIGGANNEIHAAALEPGPALGRTVNVRVLRGRVLVKTAGGAASAAQKGKGFVPLRGTRQIPVRSLVDTRRGTLRLTSARDTSGRTQTGDFRSGVFQVLQSRRKRSKGLTELRLKGSSFKRCGSSAKRSLAGAARLSRRTVRRLRAKAKGRFRTRGRYSSATVRGTTWLTSDRCDGTLTRVTRGKVAVRDFKRKRTITLRRGKSYLARARR